MSNNFFPAQKERALKTFWRIHDAKKHEMKNRDFVTADECAVGDLIYDTKYRVFCVEKITPKTITISECWDVRTDVSDFRNNRRMSHDNFAWEYRKTNLKEIARSKQLSNRLDFIQTFKRNN